jgi:hypothetical protein
MLSSGWLTGICSLNANVSEHCLFHVHRQVGMKCTSYADGTECSETLAFKLQTPVNHPEESIQHEHGESLKSRKVHKYCTYCIQDILIQYNNSNEICCYKILWQYHT